MTPRGPILVEVNARMHGVQGPLMIEKATGHGLASYVADAMLKGWQGDGGLLKKHIESGKTSPKGRWMYLRDKCAAIVMLISHVEGCLKAGIDTQLAGLELPSVSDVFPSVTIGGLIQQTTDLNTMAGYAILLHSCQKQLIEDISKIREAEAGNLYPVSPTKKMASPHMSPLQRLSSPKMSPSIDKVEEIFERAMSGLTLEEAEIVLTEIEA